MTNILTNDVQAYVREMISKEFGSVNKEEKAHWENRTLINSENHNQKKEKADYGQGNSHFGY
ncbi:MAG: hypothetical protein WBR24_02855 [Desulfobacterales bacterium]